LGIGDWGLGIGDWAQSPIPNPQSPIPNPHVVFIEIKNNKIIFIINYLISKIFLMNKSKEQEVFKKYIFYFSN